jgi:septal ring factor EnvC (AmiA/AmiB activator)|tara:strand:- start:78 stop:359 length:282 start_codon:yes stop_codon:yes gene_type:complete
MKKIILGIVAFIGFALLVFKKSNKAKAIDKKIDTNKKEIDKVQAKETVLVKEKKATKKKVKNTKAKIKATTVKKKSTKSAVKKAKDFKNKYKS